MRDHYSKNPELLKIAVVKSRETINKKYGETGLSEKISSETKEWYSKQRELLSQLNILDKDEVSLFLENKRDIYKGKAGNRKLIRDSPSIYKSLNYYCEDFKKYNNNKELPFICKIDIANNNFEVTSDMMCRCDSILAFDRQTQEWSKFYCKKCRQSPTSINHFKLKYGNEWEIKWKELRDSLPVPKGINETWILDEMEKIHGIKIDRSFTVMSFFPDGYSKDLNTIYEVNEKHHRIPSNRKKDTMRRKMIQKVLQCDFVVIWDDTLDIDLYKYV